MLRTLLLIFLALSVNCLYAQTDTLPQFSVTKKNKKITISWVNNYSNTTQINIQRSKDSNRNYITIHSTPQPLAKTYTFLDQTATSDSMFYRIFILFDGATYSFTKPKRAVEQKEVVIQTDKKNEKQNVSAGKKEETVSTSQPKKDTSINKQNPVVNKTTTQAKDSSKQTKTVPQKEVNQKSIKETLPDSIHLSFAKNNPPLRNNRPLPFKKFRISLPQRITAPWQPSAFVYTGDDGNIVIDLPDALKYKYSIVFAREEGRPLFSLPEITETKLILDKVVFLKSGWYYFELRENGKVKERNKFLITRDY